MSILGNPRFSRTLPLMMFERLQKLLQQMQSSLGEGTVVLRSDDLPIVPMGLEYQVKLFVVLVSHSFRVLALAAPLAPNELAVDGTQPRLYHVGLTFESKAIASFLTQLAQRLKQHSVVLDLLQLTQASPQSNDPAIQSEFTIALMEILTTDTISPPISPDPIYPYVSVCQPIEQALRQQVEQERLLNQVTTQIRQSLELPAILKTAVEKVRHFLEVDRLVIYQFDCHSAVATPESHTSLSASQAVAIAETSEQEDETIENSAPSPIAERSSGCVTYEARASDAIASVLHWREERDCFIHVPNCRNNYRQGITFAIDDVELSYTTSPCLLERLRQSQVRALLVAPIIVHDCLWGLLIAHQCCELRHWQDSEKLFLKKIAEYLAVAIHQAQLYAQLQQQKSTLEQRVIERTQELRDALQAAQAASLAKSDFLAAMSHELRTPLTCVIGLSATLLRWSFGEGGARTIPLEKQRHYLKTIQENGEHLLELINDILDLSQVEAGKTVLNITEFSLFRLAHQSVRSLQEKANLQEVELEIDWQIKVQGDRFRADQRRVRQILYNLLGNAIKFTPAGGRVTLRIWREKNLAIFQVEDTGIGISQEHLPLLFEKFKQLETTYHRNYEGMGLGLALTKQLVELHNGSIEVESFVGKGSIFTVWLPIQPQLPAPSKSNSAPDQSPQPKGSIVLVDNHETTATTICEILTAAGYHVVWLIDSSGALPQIELLQPRAVIVDWQLSAMDGHEIGYYLHNLPTTQRIKVLALTTPPLSPQEEQDLRTSVDDYLPKPLEPAQLLHKVTALLNYEL
ncbi:MULTISPECIES: GAF domain-containing hybrid sensor histidine kinase/response regulator [unclassified Coleofasciculus]|uniref:GAF domain-containing hybrid sensor histidine kinase/response regulator n=2 Tax=unclassified Coleofasciculus TaxID=2692782 RepID=UPI00187F2F68|nr:GAF domain-containing protein [Coleofasciculus sp. LEGE 07081]MBE9147832.1 GAF domain-containing protein [Coleofasciculus sp. LEGE 07092]